MRENSSGTRPTQGSKTGAYPLIILRGHLLHDMSVQAQVRHRSFELPALLAQLAQLAHLAQAQLSIHLFPQIKTLPADPCLRQTSTTVLLAAGAPNVHSRTRHQIGCCMDLSKTSLADSKASRMPVSKSTLGAQPNARTRLESRSLRGVPSGFEASKTNSP